MAKKTYKGVLAEPMSPDGGVDGSGIKDHPLLKHELAARAFVSRVLIRMGLEDSNAR